MVTAATGELDNISDAVKEILGQLDLTANLNKKSPRQSRGVLKISP
jgi:hypothetical protein